MFRALCMMAAFLTVWGISETCCASCPLQISSEGDATRIDYGSVSLKVEQPWIKMQMNGAFETKAWTFAPLDSGAAKIDGFVSTAYGETLVASVYAVDSGGSRDWYAFIKIDETAGSRWAVAGMLNGVFRCTVTSGDAALLRPFAASRAFMSSARLSIVSAADVYSRLGL